VTSAPTPAADRNRLVRWLAGVTVVLGVAAALIGFFAVEVCDEHVTDAGQIVEVCRHTQITDPPVIAIGLVVLASLGAFFTEISGLGISLKRDVKDAQAAARSSKEAADSAARASEVAQEVAEFAKGTAKDAEAAVDSARKAAQFAEQLSLANASSARESRADGDTATTVEAAIGVRAQEYNDTRARMPSGRERSAAMTRIVSQMIAELIGVDQIDFDVTAHLGSEDRGRRLAAYAYLYANPDPRRAQELAAALMAEDKPFGQYWAIRALRQLLARDRDALDLNTERSLRALHAQLLPGTDRAYELAAALDRDPSAG